MANANRRQDIDGALAKYRAAAQQARASINLPVAYSQQPPLQLQQQPQQHQQQPQQQAPQPQLQQQLQQPPQPQQQQQQQPMVQYGGALDHPSIAAAVAAVQPGASQKMEERVARLEQMYEQEHGLRVELQEKLQESNLKGEETEESIDQLVQLASELHTRQTDQNQRVAKIESGTAGLSVSDPAALAVHFEQRLAAQRAELEAQFAAQQERKLAEERDVYIKLLEASQEEVLAEAAEKTQAMASAQTVEQLMQGVTAELLTLRDEIDAMQQQRPVACAGGARASFAPAQLPRVQPRPTQQPQPGQQQQAEPEEPLAQLVRGHSAVPSAHARQVAAAQFAAPYEQAVEREPWPTDVATEGVPPTATAAEMMQDELDEEERLLQQDIETGATTVLQAAWRGKRVRNLDLLPKRLTAQPVAQPAAQLAPEQLQPRPSAQIVRGRCEIPNPARPSAAPADYGNISTDSDDDDFDQQAFEEELIAQAKISLVQAAYRGRCVRRQMQARLTGQQQQPPVRRMTSRERAYSLQLTRDHLQSPPASAPAPQAAASPSASVLSLEEWDDGLGDVDDSLMERAYGTANAWSPAPGDGLGAEGMVAKLAAAAMNDDDAGTDSDDSLLYEAPRGLPHIDASLLNRAQPPMAGWEQAALARERNAQLQFNNDSDLEQVLMISPRDDPMLGYDQDDSGVSFDLGLGPDSPEPMAVAVVAPLPGPVSPPPRLEEGGVKLTGAAKERVVQSGKRAPTRGRPSAKQTVVVPAAGPSTPPPREETAASQPKPSAAGVASIAASIGDNDMFRKQREATIRQEDELEQQRRDTEATAARLAEEEAWEPQRDESGNLLYVHSRTGETSWNPFAAPSTPTATSSAGQQQDVPTLPAGVRFNPTSQWQVLYVGDNRTGQHYFVKQPLPGEDDDDFPTQWDPPEEGVCGFFDDDE